MTDTPIDNLPIKFPIEPQAEMCGWCGEDAEPQGYDLQCYHCGRRSTFDGVPIPGNGHFRGNISTTFPEANAHGMPVTPGSSTIV